MEVLLQSAVPTSTMKARAPPPLWNWKFDATFRRHFPHCIRCDKRADDPHLRGKEHRWYAAGTQLSFDFPDRQYYLSYGAVLRQGGDADAAQDTTPYLPANYTLPPDVASRPGASREISHQQAVALTLTARSTRVSTKTGMAYECAGDITWHDGSTARDAFVLFACGRSREFWVATAGPWGFKCQEVGQAGTRDQNHEEWIAYRTSQSLRRFLPTVHGYFQQDCQDKRISLLLVDRVGFTFAELIKRVRLEPVSAGALNLFETASTRVVRTMFQAGEGGIAAHDWHVGNVGFSDNEAAMCLLVDWDKNRPAYATQSFIERIENAFAGFCKHLPGPHTWGPDDISDHEPNVQARILAWRRILTSMSVTLRSWWTSWTAGAKRLDQVPSSQEWGHLADGFRKVITAALLPDNSSPLPGIALPGIACPCVSSPHATLDSEPRATPPSSRTTNVPTLVPTTVATILLNDVTHVATISPTREHSGPTATDAPPGIQSAPATLDTLPGPNAASHKAAPCQESLRPEIPDEELDGMVPIKTPVDADDAERLMTVLSVSVGPPLAKVAVGREAARSLMVEAVAKHRTHLQEQFKRDRGEEPNSVLLEQRLATDTWHPDHGRPPNPSSQGDDLDLLFRALLGSLEGRGHISRMKEPPLVATNPSLFHSQFWRKFVDGCSEPWTEMSPQNKRKRLRDWMYQKFSLDPQSRCMLPGPGSKRKKRNEACWFGFELTDADLEHVLRDTMETYLAAHS